MSSSVRDFVRFEEMAHCDEWAYFLYGKARATVMSPDGEIFIGDVGEGDLWLFPDCDRFVLLTALVALPVSVFAGTLQTVTLEVKNMTCAVCPITVKKALERVPGVTDAKVDFDRKTASVSFDPDKASPAELAKATADVGYPASVRN
jgi:periplasmic mercuric ion binding protein